MRSVAISTAAIAIIAVVVVAVGGAAVYFVTSVPGPGPSGSSSSTSSTGSGSTGTFTPVPGNVSAVVSQINLMVQAFNNENVQALANFYSSSSVVVWSGNSQGLGGSYVGQSNIRILYSSSIGHVETITVKASQLKMVTEASNTVNDTMKLIEAGSSTYLGNFNATIIASQQWVSQGSTWSIQKENWNYLSFYASNPTEATVFPQWGLQVTGHNPDLASEHKIEWALAPYLAVAIYAALILTVAVIFVRRLRK